MTDMIMTCETDRLLLTDRPLICEVALIPKNLPNPGNPGNPRRRCKRLQWEFASTTLAWHEMAIKPADFSRPYGVNRIGNQLWKPIESQLETNCCVSRI
jgi:hypothetical protein